MRPATHGHVVMPRLVYILSASHSGSTLLAMLLGAHPQACTAGELKVTNLGDPENYRCSCGAPIRECAFWAGVAEEMARRGVPGFEVTRAGTSFLEVDSPWARRLLAPLHRGPALEVVRDALLALSPAWRTHRRAAGRRNVALVESLLARTGARIVVDSSKVALRLKYLLALPELSTQVIRLIRDGRAVSLTYLDEWTFADAVDPARRGGGTGVCRASPPRSMSDAAREWRRSNEAADCLVARLPRAQWTLVRYEDLCQQPEATLRRLCLFLNLDPAQARLDFRSVPQHVIGNGMRLDSHSEIRLDDRWRTHLSASDLAVFETVAGRLNRQYGYA